MKHQQLLSILFLVSFLCGYEPGDTVDVEYQQIGGKAAENEYTPSNAAALAFASGVIAGPVGLGLSYGVVYLMGTKGIVVPPKRFSELSTEESLNFEKGYLLAAQKKRRKVVLIGSGIGMLMFPVLLMYLYAGAMQGAGV